MRVSNRAGRLFVPAALLLIVLARAAYGANCPQVSQQAVVVHNGLAAPFRLAVQNVGQSSVTIFAYPRGGQLVWAGPSVLDYIFLPDGTYSGTTYASYRVEPPTGCTGTSLLGNIQFVIEGTPRLDIADVTPPPADLCGVALLPASLASITALGAVRLATRRRPS